MNFSIILIMLFLLGILGVGALVLIVVLVVHATNKKNSSKVVPVEQREVTRTLGEKIKENRMRCNMTQEYVAETVGVSRQAVSKWETGTSEPSTTNLLALAKLFHVSVEELLRGIE